MSEVPESVSQPLVQDRHTENNTGRVSALIDPLIRSRELFTSDASDTFPVTALRGKCTIVDYQDIYSAKDFVPHTDHYYYILGYNPETKRLATTQGEIRVGSSHQARLPECKPDVCPPDMPESCDKHEDLKWQPLSVMDGDLIMYLRAARSIAAFAGMCDGGSTEDGCQAASMDETTMNAMDILHDNKYDTGKSLQALVRSPALRSIDKKWTEEDLRRFIKGLKQHGKNFFKIRKELLPDRDTSDLVEYYYFWKKTASAASNRPHRRHRRTGLKRQTARINSQPIGDYLDQSSASEVSDESDDSDGGRDINTYFCRRCSTTSSKDWHHAGKDKSLLCTQCRIHFKKYGEDRPLDSPQEPPSFLFKPVQEDSNSVLNGKRNMRTRRSNNSTGNKGKKKDRLSTSSPDNVDSPVNGTAVSKGQSSPGTVSTCSNSSNDKDSKLITSGKDRLSGNRKRLNNLDSDDGKSSKKKKSLERSDSDSSSESSSNEDEEDLDGDVGLETNQDDLSSSSPPTTPSPVSHEEEFKLQKDCIKPEPQHLIVQSPPSQRPSIFSGQVSLVPKNHVDHTNSLLLRQELPVTIDCKPISHPTPLPLLPSPSQALPPSQQPLPPSVPSSRPTLLPHSQPLPSSHTPVAATHPLHSTLSLSAPFQPLYSSSLSQSTPTHPPPPLVPAQPPSANHTPPVPVLVPIKKEPTSPTRPCTWEETINKAVESADLGNQLLVDIKPPPPFSMNIDSRLDDRTRTSIKKEEREVASFLPNVPAPVRTSTPNPAPSSVPILPSQPTIKGPGLTSKVVNDGEKPLAEPKLEPEVVPVERDEDSDSEDDRGGTLTPGPDPTPCNKEVHRSPAAIFIQMLNRGSNNSCSRCDIVFRPIPDSNLAKKRENRERKQSHSIQSSSSTSLSSSSSSSTLREEKPLAKRMETPPRAHSVDIQVPHSQPSSFAERHTPRSIYTDTPALRQLSEYARPHALVGSQDVQRSLPYSMQPQVDPMMSYRLAMYPPGSRERLELELERDKRERDARERDLRERELRDMELREKMKAEMEMKPPGLDRLMPHGANIDPHWLELQRRYGYPPGAAASLVPNGPGAMGSGHGHIPGVYPPASLASDLMAREREKLDRLDILQTDHMTGRMIYQFYSQRLSNEHIYMQRVTNECYLRAQKDRVSAGVDPAHLVYQFSRADPMSCGPGPSSAAAAAVAAAGGQNHAVLSSLSHGMSPHSLLQNSREQEMLQRELYSRAYMDPALAQSLSAQAAAHHEALQRQLALERDRYGNGGHMPH